MTTEEMKKVSNWINKQEGSPYPVSNQVVVCGFVTANLDKWFNFVDDHHYVKEDASIVMKREIELKNGERWVLIDPVNHSRGFRFYKAKVDKDIDYDTMRACILPQMNYYCCEVEWI